MTNSNHRVADECDRVLSAVSRLRRALPELERRNRFQVSGDGYPATSFGGTGQRGAISKPTERAALAPKERDPVRQWTHDALRVLRKASDLAEQIDSLLSLALSDGIVSQCVACRDLAGRLRDGRCDRCYTFRRRNGHDR